MIKVLENPEIRKLIFPISVQAYQSMCESGILPIKTELIEGVVIDKMTKSPDHSYYSEILFELLHKIKPENCILKTEKPLTLKNSEPEPDIMIVQGDILDYRNQNPTTALLVVEIAKTSLSADREKIPIYANAFVQNYWILNIPMKQIETYTTPLNDDYASKKIFNQNEIISIFDSKIDLSKIFD